MAHGASTITRCFYGGKYPLMKDHAGPALANPEATRRQALRLLLGVAPAIVLDDHALTMPSRADPIVQN